MPLGERQYRTLAGAVVLSLLGAGMWAVAMVWQVMALDGGPAQLSAVATASALGLVALALLGGVTADRVPQRRILVTVELVKVVAVGTAAVLSFTGDLQLIHLVFVGLALGMADAFFYPAYSAYLPSILPPDQLLAANGIEGVLRPGIQQAAGPALAGVVLASFSPAHALAAIAVLQLLAAIWLLTLRPVPLRREITDRGNALRGTLRDLREGFLYMVRTPWVLATLLYACVMLLIIMGPIQVLLPFVVRDQIGGGPGAFAAVLATFGIGMAVGSFVIASWKLPRRYLTVMNLLWGAGCLPLLVVGFATQLWWVIAAVLVVGLTAGAANVIWGTLLQRRVPRELLGRISSLDFFVSLALMPLSMALAGPVGEWLGMRLTFTLVAVLPPILAVIAVLAARLHHDEIAHPLDS